MTLKQYVNKCVGAKDVRIREERINRSIIYNIIKGWADPKTFKASIQKFWPIEGDTAIDLIMPSTDELVILDNKFRSLGRRK